MTDTMVESPPQGQPVRDRFWEVELTLRLDDTLDRADCDAIAAAVRGYPDVRLKLMDQDVLLGMLQLTLLLPAYDAVHAVERAAHVAREAALASERSMPVIVHVASSASRPVPVA